MNLFAILEGKTKASYELKRIPLSQEVQNFIRQLFLDQEKDFNKNIESEMRFNASYKLEEYEGFFIENFSEYQIFLNAIENPLSVKQIPPLEPDFLKIKALFVGHKPQGGTYKILVQSFDRRRIISPTGFSLFHSDQVFKKIDGVGLTLDSKIIAVITDYKITFLSFFSLRRIFDMSKYYNEATNDEIKAFFDHNSIHVSNIRAFTSDASSWVRRKISSISDSEVLKNVDFNQIVISALKFKIHIQIVKINGVEKILLPANKTELRKVLQFLDEDYYESSLQNKKYRTNSKELLTQNS